MNDRLALWAWFDPVFVKNILLPEIKANCSKYGIYFPNAYEILISFKI